MRPTPRPAIGETAPAPPARPARRDERMHFVDLAHIQELPGDRPASLDQHVGQRPPPSSSSSRHRRTALDGR